MKIVNLGKTNSVLNSFVAQIRDKKVQKDRMRFRTNLRRLGQIFAYEISKSLSYSESEVVTPLGVADVSLYTDKVVVGTILRAGLPLHEGVLDYFDTAENAFVAAIRQYDAENEFELEAKYCTCPSLSGKVLILVDPMMATGSSMEVAYNALVSEGGEPACTHIVCPITSAYAVEDLSKKLPKKVTLWTAAIDEELTVHSYIVPGLGDAGDLAFGGKR